MTRKAASTTAYQAFSPRCMRLYDEFWSLPYPLGVIGTPRRRLIDIDEFGLCIESANRNFGHSLKGLRVRKMGNYGRGEVKVTVILAIETGDPVLPPQVPGSLQRPRVWCRAYPGGNTTTERYRAFVCNTVIDSFGPHEPHRTVMHDNLSAHKSDRVYDGVHMRGHRITCRPPYRPHCGPVEFAIDQIACAIRDRCFQINSIHDLVYQIQVVAGTCVTGIDDLFAKCGYQE
jgi:hypothetical protein